MKKVLPFIVLAVLFCAATAFLVNMYQKDDMAIKNVVKQLEQNDPAITYQLADAESQKNFQEEDIRKKMEEVNRLLKIKKIHYTDLKYEKASSENNKRLYKAVMVLEGEYGTLKRPLEMTFTKVDHHDHEWKVSWQPSLVLPGLSKDNTLKTDTKPSTRGRIYARGGEVLAEDKDGVRSYPYGTALASAVGFARGVTLSEIDQVDAYKDIPFGTVVGRAGLEAAFDDILRGKNGITITLSDKPEDILVQTEPTQGKDIHTTLDLKVQQASFQEISGHFGTVVAMNPQNGQVLAMADGQSYDPNAWVDQAMDENTYQEKVKQNLAPLHAEYSSIFTPGSTQKLFTSLIGLKNGIINSGTYYQIYGEDWQPDTSWGGYKVHRVTPINGPINLTQALISSDNIFFSMVGLNIGAENLVQGLHALGYAQDVPSKVPIVKSQITQKGTIDPEHQTAVADTSYGQYQLLISPMQICMTYGLLANGGNIMEPHFLLDETPKAWISQVTTPENIALLNDALRKATYITHPTAERTYAAFTGKTGTAEVGADGSINLGWYAGYDQNNPNCTMVVMVNGVQNAGGSDYNTAMFGRIMDVLYRDGAYKPA